MQNDFRQALDRFSALTLTSSLEFQVQAGDWTKALQTKRRLLELTQDPDERSALYREIGDLLVSEEGDLDEAAAAYRQALELRPDDTDLLHALLDLHVKAERWEEVIATTDRLAQLEDDAGRRGRYCYSAGVLLRDKLGAPTEAIARFEQALCSDHSRNQAFKALVQLATAAGDDKALERSYRLMLQNLPTHGPEQLKLALWSDLAEIYRTRLADPTSAAVALDVAARLDPSNVERRVELSTMYDQLVADGHDEHVDAAVRVHRQLLADEPFRMQSYHALFDLYRHSGRIDEAHCVASALSFLDKATSDEQAWLGQHPSRGLPMARARLSEDTLRRHIVHPDQDPYLTAVFGVIAAAVAAWRAVELPGSLHHNERIDVTTDPSLLSRMANYVTSVLPVSVPDVYLRPNDMGDLTLMNIKRDSRLHPTIVVFQNLLRGKTESHLAFALGRYLMDLYLPHLCFVAVDRSPQALRQVLLACLHGAGRPVDGDQAALDCIGREIFGRMSPAARDLLRSLLPKCIEASDLPDVRRWAAASELTAYRVGLLLSGDLRIAAQMISMEQAPLGVGATMSPRDKIKELVLYSISADYVAARKALGLTISR